MTLVESETFAGFPSSGLATAVPSLFFSRLLPQIEDAEELIVSVYFFFAQSPLAARQGHKRRSPRFLTQRELEADATLVGSLSRICRRDGREALQAGLLLAVQRGTLLRAAVVAGGHEEELYVVNNPANRKGLRSMAGAGLSLEEPLPPSNGSAAPNIFALYEQNVGSITPLIADDLKEAEERYPAEWIRDAVRESVELNKRSWRYIERILRRWETEGRDYEEPERDSEGQWLARRYTAGKRGGTARA
jgi:DnaD/phage-associated family protein